MITFEIITPTKARITNYTKEEMDWLSSFLSYRNLSAVFTLDKHLKKEWLAQKNPDYFEDEKNRLESLINCSLLFKDGGFTCTYPGIIPYISIPYSVKNNINYPKFKLMPWAKPLPFDLYPYQQESLENLLEIKHGHVSLPTGAGKTALLLSLVKKTGLTCVIVTPSQSIFSELLHFFETHLGKGKVGGFGDGKKDIKKQVTIAIGRSITMLKEDSEAWNFFESKEVLAVDESHTWGADELSGTCHGVLKDIPYRFFVSATQTRGNGTDKLLYSIIGQCVKEMSIEEAIKNKYLCPLKFKIIPTISPSTKYITDPIENKRAHFLRNTNIAELTAKIANASWNVKQESTLILVEELGQIAMLSKLITVPFSYVHAGSKKEANEYGLEKVDPQEEIEKFNKGDVRVLIGTKCIATGTNLYPTHNTINWAGGSSEIVTKQGAMGRSTRILENSKYKDLHKPKPHALIYDFNVQKNKILEGQLKKRIKFYEETGEEVVY